MSKKERTPKEYNLHHILPSSRGGLTNDINCEMIRKTTHSAIHTLFSNEIFPEQLIRLANLNAKALLPEVVQELSEILKQRDIHDPEQRYKEWCLRIPKHTIQR